MNDTTIDGSGWGSSSDWDAILKWVFGDLAAPSDAGCDGGLVAQVLTTNAAELAAKTQGGATFRKPLQYPGNDSPIGCGENSLYFVTYSFTYKYIPDSTM